MLADGFALRSGSGALGGVAECMDEVVLFFADREHRS